MKVANSKLIIWSMLTSSLREMLSINYQNIRKSSLIRIFLMKLLCIYDAITLCMYDVWNGAGFLIF